MLVKNTLTLTTLLKLDPAAVRTADRFWMQRVVISEMVDDGRVRIVPVDVHGIWPEQ